MPRQEQARHEQSAVAQLFDDRCAESDGEANSRAMGKSLRSRHLPALESDSPTGGETGGDDAGRDQGADAEQDTPADIGPCDARNPSRGASRCHAAG